MINQLLYCCKLKTLHCYSNNGECDDNEVLGASDFSFGILKYRKALRFQGLKHKHKLHCVVSHDNACQVKAYDVADAEVGISFLLIRTACD